MRFTRPEMAHGSPAVAQPRIELVLFDAGGGHRAAANALRAAIEAQHPWRVETYDLQAALDSIDIARQLVGVRSQDVYNAILRREVTRGLDTLLRLLHGAIRFRHRVIVDLLAGGWRERRPDFVVSLIPHFNRALFESLREVSPDAEMATVLTDLADYPPRFWIDPPGAEGGPFVVCGTAYAASQAREIGVEASRIVRASGMMLHPRFYRRQAVDVARGRRMIDFASEVTTLLVTFGGFGSPRMVRIARELDALEDRCQVIFICGRNVKVKQTIESMSTRYAKHVEGFTDQMPYWMTIADLFLGKPGPGSISEALASQLPLVIDARGGVLPQERFNLEWIRRNRLGVVIERGQRLAAEVGRLCSPEALAAQQGRVQEVKNRAVFDVVDFLAQRLAGRSHGRSAPPGAYPRRRRGGARSVI